MKRTIRSLALVLAAVAGLVAFTPTEARADHYWSNTYNRNVTYHFAYEHPHGYPVYLNEFGRYFHYGHGGHRVFVSSHHRRFVFSHRGYRQSGHHGYRQSGHHASLFDFLLGY